MASSGRRRGPRCGHGDPVPRSSPHAQPPSHPRALLSLSLTHSFSPSLSLFVSFSLSLSPSLSLSLSVRACRFEIFFDDAFGQILCRCRHWQCCCVNIIYNIIYNIIHDIHPACTWPGHGSNVQSWPATRSGCLLRHCWEVSEPVLQQSSGVAYNVNVIYNINVI